MQNKIILVLILFCTSTSLGFATNYGGINYTADSTKVISKKTTVSFNFLPKISLFNKKTAKTTNKSKLVAGLLAIALGPFGVHRLYLGTSPKVPIAYTLTLGGGFFVLPLIDIFYIILSRNPEDIENNNHVFIWNKKKTQ